MLPPPDHEPVNPLPDEVKSMLQSLSDMSREGVDVVVTGDSGIPEAYAKMIKRKNDVKLTLLAFALLFGLSGCSNPFRDGPVIMYRDGWGGTNVVVPDPWQPVPYGASMPPANGGNQYPETLHSGWYLGKDKQWRPQRWVRLGTDQNGNPSYLATYP
jgi:hypothetical protein